MLHVGNHTCGDHPFTYSASHKDRAIGTRILKSGFIRPKDREFGTKNLKFGLIRPKDRFPPV